eukprot:scaffold23541_cov19-Tisochrysis_lutea.AAC.1
MHVLCNFLIDRKRCKRQCSPCSSPNVMDSLNVKVCKEHNVPTVDSPSMLPKQEPVFRSRLVFCAFLHSAMLVPPPMQH